MQVTRMDVIKADIKYNSPFTNNKQVAENILDAWRGSPKIRDMKDAEMYSKVMNTAINYKTRAYKDSEGHIVQNETLANTKSRTAQYRKSLKQKIDFALAKDFVISCDDDKYKDAWAEFLDNKTRAVIKRTSKNAINKGIGWTYPWINAEGKLQIIDVVPETIYPAWRDTAHTELDAIVRDYIVTEYINQNAQDIYKVEYWDSKIVEKYIDYSQAQGGSGDLVPDTEGEIELDEETIDRASIQKTHMVSSTGEGISWDKVPFIPLKGDEDELPLLNECRDDVDNYDYLKSKAIDSLLDDIDAVLTVEGISADMGTLQEARQMVKNSRIVSVDIGGHVDFVKVDANISAILQQLELIKKDIQDNTSTVDLTTIQFGSNPSGKAMRAFFEALNQWANDFESCFQVYMEELKYFFDKWLSWKGGFGTFEELQNKKVTFTLDRDMMVDEEGIIDNLVKLESELSQETRDELNPYVESHEKEEERREEDRQKAIEQGDLMIEENDTNSNIEDEEEDNNEEDKNNANNK